MPRQEFQAIFKGTGNGDDLGAASLHAWVLECSGIAARSRGNPPHQVHLLGYRDEFDHIVQWGPEPHLAEAATGRHIPCADQLLGHHPRNAAGPSIPHTLQGHQ